MIRLRIAVARAEWWVGWFCAFHGRNRQAAATRRLRRLEA